jgi:hypothetical protein
MPRLSASRLLKSRHWTQVADPMEIHMAGMMRR